MLIILVLHMENSDTNFVCFLTYFLLVATFVSADNLCKQFEPRTVRTQIRTDSVVPDLDPNCLTL